MDIERSSRAEPCGLRWCVGARAPGARARAAGAARRASTAATAGAAGRAAGPGARAEVEAGVYAAGCGQAAVFAGQGDAKRAAQKGSTGAGRSTGTDESGSTGDADGAGGNHRNGADQRVPIERSEPGRGPVHGGARATDCGKWLGGGATRADGDRPSDGGAEGRTS